jgi:PAS domain S-box-containing protein
MNRIASAGTDMNRAYSRITLENEDDRRTARILRVFLLASLATYLVAIVAGVSWRDWQLVTVTATGSVFQAVPYWLLRRGNLRASGLVIVIGVLGTLTVNAMFGEGIHDYAIIAYPIVIVFAGLILPKAGFRVGVLLTLGSVGWLVFGEAAGWFVPQPFEMPTWADFVIVALILAVGAVAVHLLATNVRGSLGQAREELAQRKRAEEKLQLREMQLRTILESTGDGILAVDNAGRVITTNQSFADLWQIPSEILGEGTDEALLIHVSDQLVDPDAFLERIQALYASTVADSDIILFKDGRMVERYSSPLLSEGVINGRVWSFRDITERKRAEESLVGLSERNELILRSAAEGILGLDSRGNHTFVNPAAARMLGYEVEELLGNRSHDLWHHTRPDGSPYPQEECKVYAAYREGLEHRVYDEVFWRKDGTSVPVEYASTPIFEQGRPTGAVVTFADITERKRAEGYKEMGREVLQILNEPGGLKDSVQRVTAALQTGTGFDAVGIRLHDGKDFPYFAHDGFPEGFVLAEQTLVERGADGEVCRDADGNVALECTCGLVISGKTDPAHPLFTPGGSFWTNDSLPLLDLPPDEDPRRNPRNRCLRLGYASMALVPIKDRDRIVGLIHLNDRRKGRLTLEAVELLEGIATNIGAALMHRRAEEALRRVRFSIDFAAGYILWTDSDGRFIDVSQSACARLGYSRDELLTMSVFDVTVASSPATWPGRWRELKENGSITLERQYRTKGGEIFPVEISTSIFDYEGQELALLTVRDITERRQADEKLTSSQRRLHDLNVLQGLLLKPISLEEKLRLVTETAVRVGGADFARIWMVRPGDRCEADCVHAQAGEELHVCQVRDRCLHLMASSGRYTHTDGRDHSRVPFGCYKIGMIAAAEESGFLTNEVTSDPRVHNRAWAGELGLVAFAGYRLVDTDATPVGVLALFSKRAISPEEDLLLQGIADVASQVLQASRVEQTLRERDDQLRQSQKMEAVGQLAGGIAHDFNNLLAAILGYSDLLLASQELADATAREDVEEIRHAAQRAAALTKQVLAFSRRQTQQLAVVSLSEVLDGMEALLRRTLGEDIDLLCLKDPDLDSVEADAHQLEQVLMNLAVNARDAMPSGGQLTLETANVELGEEYCRTHPETTPGGHVMLAVTDTGTGMDNATLEHIFEPFFTTKAVGAGTGLGLATVYGIVRQSHGSISVSSERGKGTSFKIYLPRVTDAVSVVIPVDSGAPSARGEETILVVEDEVPLRNLVARVLGGLGYRVFVAGTGPEALRIAKEADFQLDLLLTDVVLPGGVQGNELARDLLSHAPDLPVLYVSGYARDAIVHAGRLDAGVNFLEKPFTPETLATKVRLVLDRPRGSA